MLMLVRERESIEKQTITKSMMFQDTLR
jgi:hypothetical protein